MIILALLTIPFAAAGASILIKPDRARRILVIGTAAVHLTMVAGLWVHPVPADPTAWLAVDPLGLMFLSITSLLFFCSALYSVFYLKRVAENPQYESSEDDVLFGHRLEARFSAWLCLFLGSMSLVCLCRNFGLLWVAIEATTLFTAPLIFFKRNRHSLEATWKYLVLCSVGIALALLGNFFMTIAAVVSPEQTVSLFLPDLIESAPSMHRVWLKAAFLLFFVGYGTKIGLAPLHNWLPDAHTEAPSLVSALLSGALCNCSFLALMRVQQIMVAAGLSGFTEDVYLVIGLLSMAVAAVFILGQGNYKRMLAYSTVEHMGIAAFGIGVGGSAIFGSMLQVVNSAVVKSMLFLVAGNILAAYRTKTEDGVRGMLQVMPVSAGLWIAGLFAITGAPPFGVFFGKWVILAESFAAGRFVAAVLFLFFLAVIFIGMSKTMLEMGLGASKREKMTENPLSLAPPLILALISLVLGLVVPTAVSDLLHQAARLLGGS
jgi:hydrogenase-4 component F